MKRYFQFAVLSIIVMAALSACFPESPEQKQARSTVAALSEQIAQMKKTTSPAISNINSSDFSSEDITVSYTLITGEEENKLVFIGSGGEIDGLINPTLSANPGDVVQITLVNGHPVEHDLYLEVIGVSTGSIKQQGESKAIIFKVEQNGVYAYYCTIPGHRAAGMEGILQVGQPEIVSDEKGDSIVKSPIDLPGPLGVRGPQLVQVELTAQEIVGNLSDGTTYPYFTFNGTVPGPFIRVRVEDTVELTLNNETGNTLIHSIDLHAVNGPGGGAVYSSVNPGETKTFTFRALTPGIYVYHCATPSVPHHIASGMYGLILVEPAGGLPKVDREFYVMQGEIYTNKPFGTSGEMEFDHQAMLDEKPEYFVFNGAANALTTEENALHAIAGETVRIFIGVGGPNFTSSFHVIGEMFDRVYPFGSLTSQPLTDVQTISVAPGSAWIVEFKIDVPGRYILVDHALSRLERGLAGYLIAEGNDQPDIFHEGAAIP